MSRTSKNKKYEHKNGLNKRGIDEYKKELLEQDVKCLKDDK